MNFKNNKSIKTYLLLFFISFIVFANTISHDYAWDDKIVIQENPRVKKGISGIPALFTKYSSQFQYDQYSYRPITLISFAIDYDLSHGSPHFSHFMNVFYYSILSVLIFIFLSSLFSKYHPIFAFLATLLFIVHPLHVEVVANIKSRDEIFGLLFSIASLIYFLNFLKKNNPLYLIGTVAFYLLAYLSKENSITLLAIFPLVFLVEKSYFSKKSTLLYAGSAAVLFVISYLIFKYAESSTAGAQTSEGLGIYKENPILGNSFLYVGNFWQKIANAFHILLLYLKNFIIPYPLIYFYGYNVVPVTNWSNPVVWLSALLHIGILVLGIRYWKKRPEILFGFLFYLISISVYTHIVRPLADTMADRFLFTASLGLCISLVGILGLIFKINFTWFEKKEKSKSSTPLTIFEYIKMNLPYSSIVILFAVVFGLLSITRNNVWKDDLTLVTHDLPYMENCSRAHFYYASLLKKEMTEKPSKKAKLEPIMLKEYHRSIAISDSAYLSYLDLGTYYCSQGRYDEGIPILEKGTKLFPKASEMSYFLGQSYVLIGKFKEAVPHLEKSLQLAYRNAHNYYFLAVSYSKMNQFDKALETVSKGMKEFPNQELMFCDAMANIYFDKGELDKSIEYSFKLIDLGKPPQEVYSKIISRCYQKGEKEKGDRYKAEARQRGFIIQ